MKFSEDKIWNVLRVFLSAVFLWAFFDKVFGLGFATDPTHSWLQGISPTAKYLQFGAKGIFAPFFHVLSGNPIIDLLFMLGLFLVGMSLLLGVGIRVACISGSFLLFLIYLSSFPPMNNPLIDEHIVYIVVLVGILVRSSHQSFGLSKKWSQTPFVKKYPLLK